MTRIRLLLTLGFAMLIGSLSLSSSWSAYESSANPCAGLLNGNFELATSRSQSLAVDPDSGYADMRTRYNLL